LLEKSAGFKVFEGLIHSASISGFGKSFNAAFF
jgi:hypothetical protein